MRKTTNLFLIATFLIIPLLALDSSLAAAATRGLSPADFLNPDGTLIVPENFSGSFDLAGWDVQLDPSLGAVFSPPRATTGQWSSLGGAGTGLSDAVNGIDFNAGVLYAGGDFTNAGGDPDADYIAQFSGGAWSSLGGAGTGLSDAVNGIDFNAGVLYAGGAFTDAGGDADADHIAQFSGGAWSSLGGVGTGLNATVRDIEFNGGVLYAGGSFSDAGGNADADRIAQFSGGAWSSLGGAGTGLNNIVRDIEFNGGVLYAGGFFTNAGGDADADSIAQSSGGAWSSLGGAGTGLSSAVRDIEFNGGVLYAGGDFTNAGGDAEADYSAQFSGGAWFSLGGAGTGLNDSVFDIEFNGGVLYAGGDFSDAGGDADSDFIAQFGLPVTSSGGQEEGQTCSQEINSSGTTLIVCGRIRVSVPESAIPAGETNCKVVIKEVGEAGEYGFTLDDTVWDVKIICDSGEVNIFFAPITVCIRPKDGVTTNKSVFHNHGGGFAPIAGGTGPSGYVCGSTQALSLFTLSQFGLPDTGFAPGAVTELREQPVDSTYTMYDGLTLEIPQLNLIMPIWGVPQSENGWDVSWLGANAGYLYGTAFPTWVGNSVLTAHVWNADNTAGPFYNLKDLAHGDQFYIRTGGQTYTYEVRSNQLVSEWNLSVMNASDYSLITLITCESFDEDSGAYTYRRAVQAVLVDVQ